MTFKYEMQPEFDNDNDPIMFIFQDGKILVKILNKSASIPILTELNELNFDLNDTEKRYFGLYEDNPCYYLEIPLSVEPSENMSFLNLRRLYGLLKDEILWIAGRAFQILNWDKNSRYCGSCGNQTVFKSDEKGKICPECSLLVFPRISPAIIVGVLKDNQILLAHGTRFPTELYSVIAGFVEPGETLEECIKREIKEEIGIEVENIRYFSSQSWPFPDSLMIGFLADYSGGEITIDQTEIRNADWFTAENLPLIPGKISIARKIIDWFVANY